MATAEQDRPYGEDESWKQGVDGSLFSAWTADAMESADQHGKSAADFYVPGVMQFFKKLHIGPGVRITNKDRKAGDVLILDKSDFSQARPDVRKLKFRGCDYFGTLHNNYKWLNKKVPHLVKDVVLPAFVMIGYPDGYEGEYLFLISKEQIDAIEMEQF